MTNFILENSEDWLVSIIIPAFNAERFLPRAIRSAQAQTYQQLETLVIDDGSNDRTFEIATATAAGDDRVRIIRQANQGVAVARNAGIRAARGDLIAPLDA